MFGPSRECARRGGAALTRFTYLPNLIDYIKWLQAWSESGKYPQARIQPCPQGYQAGRVDPAGDQKSSEQIKKNAGGIHRAHASLSSGGLLNNSAIVESWPKPPILARTLLRLIS
jgi:hypothetical protein